MQDHVPKEITDAIPAVLGAAGAAAFSKEAMLRTVILFLIASGLGYEIQQPASVMLGIPPVLTGVFIGAFGIPIIGKGLEVLQTLPLAQYLQKWIESKFPQKD